jgi:hypothetical protein
MDWSELARYEWMILELAVLGLLIAELVSVRRSIRRDRERAAKDKADAARDDDARKSSES